MLLDQVILTFLIFFYKFKPNHSIKEMRQGNPMYETEPRNNYNQQRNSHQMNGQQPIRAMNYQYDDRYENDNSYSDNSRNGPNFDMPPVQNGFYNQRVQHRKYFH